LAAHWIGWENVAHVEIDEFCNQVVAHHFSKSRCYTDIKQFDGTEYKGQIDIISGGFPCQPYSTAGKRFGKEDDRHLWPEMLRVIREVQPCYVVGENVRGLLNWNEGLVFDEVQADLEDSGYEVLPFLLPACAVNAPHERYRIWFAANTNAQGLQVGVQSEKRKTTGTPKTPKGGKPSRSNTEENAWAEFPTISPVHRRNDGISNRVDRIKALGNSIVPQVAHEIFKAIEATND